MFRGRWFACAVLVTLWACGDAGEAGDTGGTEAQDAGRGGSGGTGGTGGNGVVGAPDAAGGGAPVVDGPLSGGAPADAALPGGPLAEAAIGPEGGMLEGPGFRLEVTPGALDHVETLRVFAEAAPVLPADTTALGGACASSPRAWRSWGRCA